MSQRLISRNPCLRRMREEGYTVEIRSSFLLVQDVPFVTPDRKVERGTLAFTLGTLAGDLYWRRTPGSAGDVHRAGTRPTPKGGFSIRSSTRRPSRRSSPAW